MKVCDNSWGCSQVELSEMVLSDVQTWAGFADGRIEQLEATVVQLIQVVGQLVEVLTPEQQKKLAAMRGYRDRNGELIEVEEDDDE